MDFQTFSSTINSGFSGRVFTFRKDLLSSFSINALLDDFWDEDQIIVTSASGAVEDESNQTIRIQGVSDQELFGGSGLRVDLLFSLVAGEGELYINVSGFSVDWNIAKAELFKRMSDTFFASLPFSEIHLILDSQKKETLPVDFQLELGFSVDDFDAAPVVKDGVVFQAQLSKSAFDNSLQSLLFDEQTDNILVSGPIFWVNGSPKMWLKSTQTTSLTIGSKSFSCQLEILSILSSLRIIEGEAAPYTLGRLSCSHSVKLGGKLTALPFSISWYGLQPSLLSLKYSSLGQDTSLRLADIPFLIEDITDATAFIPEEFPAFDSVKLAALDFNLTRTDHIVIESANLSLAVNKEWTILSDLIKFGGLEVGFRVDRPGETDFSVAAMAKGTATIGGQIIAASIELPSLQFTLYLPHNTVFDIKALAEELMGADIEMPKLNCTAFLMNGDIRSSNYSMQAEIESDWVIDLGATTLSLQKIGLNIDYYGASASTNGSIYGQFGIANTSFGILAVSNPSGSGWSFSGGTLVEQAIPIGELMADISSKFSTIELPEVLSGLTISNLQVSFNTQTKDFHFLCAISFPLEDGKIAQLSLSIDIVNTTNDYRKTFSGILTFGTRQLSVVFDKTTTTSNLIAAFENREGEDINLITDVIGLVTDPADLDLSNDEFDVLALKLYLLEFSYSKESAKTTYGFKSDVVWMPKIGLNSDADSAFSIRALVNLKKEKGSDNGVYGILCGSIENEIEGLEFLSLAACYEMYPDGSKIMKLLLNIGAIPLEATYAKTETTTTLNFGVRKDNDELGITAASAEEPSFTLGDIASFFVSLVDPSVIEYEFDPPWDGLAKIDLLSFLENLSLKLEIVKATGKKNVTRFSIVLDLKGLLPSSIAAFVSIDALSLTYVGNPSATNAKDKRSVNISIEGKFLGQSVSDLNWDPVNDSAPEVPGQGAALFDLRYLGLGQRVAIRNAANVTSIGEVMGLLRGVIDENQQKLIADRSLSQGNPMATFGDDGPIAFSPESEWLIGLDVSLLKILNLSVIFNDPVIYGLRIELYGKMAKNFAGLKFEILYQKITDDIGKYHIDLTLPDFVRHFTVGAVSVTLPIIVVDIFTNGDFKVDLGFPWNYNFSRSFAIEVFPFTGAGGFYFNKLSAATATSTPAVLVHEGSPVGVFTPVYEFGLGLKLGLGKTFNYGPLKAEISITVQGMIEGVISWFNPRAGGDKELYYAIRGGVAIVGRLYGEVDFVVVSVSVEVIARASIQFVVESYKDIQIKLEAEVSVKAKAKVLFVTVKFTFKLKVKQNFTIDGPQHGQTAPWLKVPGARNIAARAMAMSSRSLFSWSWDNKTLWKEDKKKELDLFLQPAYSWVADGSIPHADRVKGEVLLFIENANGEDERDFGAFAQALFQWTCKAGEVDEAHINLEDISSLYTHFTSSTNGLFSFDQLSTFLFRHFVFHVQAKDEDMEGTIFPVFPQLSLTLGATDKGKFEDVDCQLSDRQLRDLKAYFAQLKVQFAPASEFADSSQTATAGISKTPITEFIFADYAKIVIRASLQAAKSYIEKNGSQSMTNLLNAMPSEQEFMDIPNMASRFLMHGLHLPSILDEAGDVEYAAQSLYQATGQQFLFKEAKAGAKYIIKLTDTDDTAAFKFAEDPAVRHFSYELDDVNDTSKIRFPLLNTVNTLTALTEAEIKLPSASPSLINYYGEEANQINFALRRSVKWGTTNTLVNFPKSLTAYLQRKLDNPVFSFNKVPVSDEDTLIENKEAVAAFSWATRIDVLIKKVPNTNNDGFLPGTYLMDGTSEAEKDLLEAIALHLNDNPSEVLDMKLVYAKGSESDDSEIIDLHLPITIIKANLSTESHVGTATRDLNAVNTQGYSAATGDPRKFMQFVWEGSTVNSGGYFISIPQEDSVTDEALFKQGDTGQIILIIAFPAIENVLDFNNCAIIKEPINLTEELLLAQSAETIPVLRIPAGHLGFTIDRPLVDDTFTDIQFLKEAVVISTPKDDGTELTKLPANTVVDAINTSGNYICIGYGANRTDYGWVKKDSTVFTMPAIARNELDELYQLLGYEVNNHPIYTAGIKGLPIGPTGEDSWLYERIIPTFNALAADVDGLPAPTRDPYLGVSTQTTFQIKSWWQDLYGNKLGLDTKVGNKSFSIAYTDPLIGINQWPSVSERYRFVAKSDIQANLIIEFTFDVSPYLAVSHASVDSRQKTVDAALAKYEQIYFQLKQSDVKLSLHTSLLLSADDRPFQLGFLTREIADKQDDNNNNTAVFISVLTFVEGVYKYLKAAQEMVSTFTDPTTLPAAYTGTFELTFKDNNGLKFQKDFIFGLNVSVEITRGLSFIHSSLLDPSDSTKINVAYENVVRSIDYLSAKVAKVESTEAIPSAGQSLQALVDDQSEKEYTVADLVMANSGLRGLLADNVLLNPSALVPNYDVMKLKQADWALLVNADPIVTVSTERGRSLETLRADFQTQLNEVANTAATIEFTLADLAAVLANDNTVLASGQSWRLPPGPSKLLDFATDFEAAFPGLHLAVSEDRESKNQAPDETKSLYVAQIGVEGIRGEKGQGVSFDIQEQRPVFYAIPPMANTLLSEKVSIDTYGTKIGGVKQFDSIDINTLARDFLVAVEDFLEPEGLINAHQLAATEAEDIIAQKSILADAISDLVEPILQEDVSATTTGPQEEAMEAIRQQMLINLVEGYDIETIIQFEVAVTVADQLANTDELSRIHKPRIVGKAKVLKILQGEDPMKLTEVNPSEYDFSLSLGKIELQQVTGTSYFTYLFDTKTPEKYSNLYLELEFDAAAIEYNIETVPGIIAYQASDWLTLVRPGSLKQSMGQSAIPIPLRDYPMPPSLIYQRAEADPTSRELLTDVRQWKYSIVYEHPDVAQDRVDCMTKLNIIAKKEAETTTGQQLQVSARDTLIESLINFSEVYPEMRKDLSLFRTADIITNDGNKTKATEGLRAFSALVKEVATNWATWELPDTSITHLPNDGDLHFEISEEPSGEEKDGFVTTLKTIAPITGFVMPDPILELPGYKESSAPVSDGNVKTFSFEVDPENQTFFGDSSIPDRKFIIENLDVIPQQNAWASIWLSRNKGLLKTNIGTKADPEIVDIKTNSKFVFNTAAVRFANMVTPVIINDEPWDIATLNSADDSPQKRTLTEHLQLMFSTLFPTVGGQNYELQLSCRYAFALASGLGLNDDLKPSLPVLMGLRLSSLNQIVFKQYPGDLSTEINAWLTNKKPSKDEASLIFSINLFSKLDSESETSLPMLRIKHLELKLDDIDATVGGER